MKDISFEIRHGTEVFKKSECSGALHFISASDDFVRFLFSCGIRKCDKLRLFIKKIK